MDKYVFISFPFAIHLFQNLISYNCSTKNLIKILHPSYYTNWQKKEKFIHFFFFFLTWAKLLLGKPPSENFHTWKFFPTKAKKIIFYCLEYGSISPAPHPTEHSHHRQVGALLPKAHSKWFDHCSNVETSEPFIFEAGVLTSGQMGCSGRSQAVAAFPQFSCLRPLQTDLWLPPSAWDGIRAPCITRCLPCYSCCTAQIYDSF